jgi:hypothetical protein
MQFSRGKLFLYFLLIFLAGGAAGVLGHLLWSSQTVSAKAIPATNNEDWRKKYVDSMRERLKMSSDQLQKLDDTLDETRVEYRLLRKHYQPEMEKIHQGQVEKIKKFLKPEQLSEFLKMEQEREEKMKARESGPGL